jgi:hypothetical protein
MKNISPAAAQRRNESHARRCARQTINIIRVNPIKIRVIRGQFNRGSHGFLLILLLVMSASVVQAQVLGDPVDVSQRLLCR